MDPPSAAGSVSGLLINDLDLVVYYQSAQVFPNALDATDTVNNVEKA
jgi:hypothetical protein